MAEPQLSVRSARARDLAHKLARRENRSIAEIVERALESYAEREAGRVSADVFFDDLVATCGTDIDLDAVIREHRKPNPGIDL
jgi:hypothetical protein